MKNIYILFLCFFCYSCEEKNNAKENVANQNYRYEDSALNFVMKKFELSYSENFKPDSNSLVFYSTVSFDTSFLLHLQKESGGIKGVYYEVLPTYHNNVNDVIIGKGQLLFFEGYNFVLDSTKWQLIKSKAEELLRDTSFRNSPGCRDCKEYGLSYSFKSKVDNGVKYEPFYIFLKELFLERLIQERRPFVDRGRYVANKL